MLLRWLQARFPTHPIPPKPSLLPFDNTNQLFHNGLVERPNDRFSRQLRLLLDPQRVWGPRKDAALEMPDAVTDADAALQAGNQQTLADLADQVAALDRDLRAHSKRVEETWIRIEKKLDEREKKVDQLGARLTKQENMLLGDGSGRPFSTVLFPDGRDLKDVTLFGAIKCANDILLLSNAELMQYYQLYYPDGAVPDTSHKQRQAVARAIGYTSII
uniref:Mug135-like C-terminal domain-containing protein n=1 Tax=Mycena chlorophos TaxID=658473 RepID=A0ABQ0M0K2_MYCCL|nr:predicted protein [Mycena chlorophos]